MSFIELSIVNWMKHQKRKDIKHPNWFSLQNRILEDSKLFDLSDAEWKCFIYVLCQASQQNSEHVKINAAHALRVCGIKKSTIDSTISKLTNAGVTCAYGSVRERHATLHYTTLQDTTEHNIAQPPSLRSGLDFDALYQKYPRKIGKQRGIQRCKTEIKTSEDYELLSSAIDRYSAKIVLDKTEERFIKHFSSFMATWRDWADPECGKVASGFSTGGVNDASYLEDYRRREAEVLAKLEVVGGK